MSPPDPGKKLAALLKRIGTGQAPPDPWAQDKPEDGDPLLWHLVFSFMAWEAGPVRALEANRRIQSAVVDYNELRVCLPDELTSVIGRDYPFVRERATRLRATLGEIYRRENRVTLTQLYVLGKREARMYLESLEGMPLFVAARISLLSLDAHAFPLDERLRCALLQEQALPPELDIAEQTGWLERYFRAGEAAEPYILLEHWLTQRPAGQGEHPASPRVTRS